MQHEGNTTALVAHVRSAVAARVVMEVLGHSRIGVTLDLYTHVTSALLGDAAAAMDRALGGH
jgi:integrase